MSTAVVVVAVEAKRAPGRPKKVKAEGDEVNDDQHVQKKMRGRPSKALEQARAHVKELLAGGPSAALDTAQQLLRELEEAGFAKAAAKAAAAAATSSDTKIFGRPPRELDNARKALRMLQEAGAASDSAEVETAKRRVAEEEQRAKAKAAAKAAAKAVALAPVPSLSGPVPVFVRDVAPATAPAAAAPTTAPATAPAAAASTFAPALAPALAPAPDYAACKAWGNIVFETVSSTGQVVRHQHRVLVATPTDTAAVEFPPRRVSRFELSKEDFGCGAMEEIASGELTVEDVLAMARWLEDDFPAVEFTTQAQLDMRQRERLREGH